MSIEPGQPVVVTDAFGGELDRIAISKPQRGADFGVIWVCRPEEWRLAAQEHREPDGVPWPFEDVAVSGTVGA